MYRPETWAQTKVISSSLKTADMKALPRITGVINKDRVNNEVVVKMTSLVDLDKLQKRSRLRGCDGMAMFTEEKKTICQNQQTMFQSPGKDQ